MVEKEIGTAITEFTRRWVTSKIVAVVFHHVLDGCLYGPLLSVYRYQPGYHLVLV